MIINRLQKTRRIVFGGLSWLRAANGKLSSPPHGAWQSHKDDPAGLLKLLVRCASVS